MEFLDARRLTGPNLHFDEPAAVLDVACCLHESALFEASWRHAVATLWSALGERSVRYSRIDHEGGISVAFTAPIDALYLATEVNQLAFAMVAAGVDGGAAPEIAAELDRLRTARDDESKPDLHLLSAAAERHHVTLLWDDDHVSLGMGVSAGTWPARALPAADTVDWSAYRDIPVGIVTGTNGKTTTVRLAQYILRVAGRTVGVSSTDWIAINDRIVASGDWSGPGGARRVLRQPVDTAILEAARGGLLRRGLGIRRADVALITNISADHLGDFGSRSLAELLSVKWLVSRAVVRSGTLVLNADDEQLVAKADAYAGRIAWFGLEPTNPVITSHRDAGGLALVANGSQLLLCNGTSEVLVCREEEIPVTLGGSARHNTANALAAAALCTVLGAQPDDIRRGLTGMSQRENPGRSNVFEVGRRRILVDFAHNPGAMRAVAGMARALPAKGRALCFGQAGDRPDELIRAVTREAWAIGLERVYVSELADYYRGRAPGEVYGLIRDELLRLGADPAHIEHHELESDSFAAAMTWANDGDLVIMLALGGSGPVLAEIEALIRATG